MKRKKISLTLFFLGLFLILYPLISQGYYEGKFKEQVKDYHEQIKENEQVIASHQSYNNYNQTTISRPENIEEVEITQIDDEEPTVTYDDVDLSNIDILGSISIPSINLLYPIFDGASDANLLKGVARVEGTSYPVGGLNTNSVIAGHTGGLNHVFFSNIHKLEIGDTIFIQNAMETLTYKVYDTAIINPDQFEALTVILGQDTLTLLTCTWDYSQRLLVYAKRVQNDTSDQISSDQNENHINHSSPTYTELEKEPAREFLQNYSSPLILFLLGIGIAYFIFIRNEK